MATETSTKLVDNLRFSKEGENNLNKGIAFIAHGIGKPDTLSRQELAGDFKCPCTVKQAIPDYR